MVRPPAPLRASLVLPTSARRQEEEWGSDGTSPEELAQGNPDAWGPGGLMLASSRARRGQISIPVSVH